METAISQRKKIHPHKFTLWVGIGSIVMMFAGMTSAYIVKRNQAGWVGYELPLAFWYSTAVIIISSLTLHLAQKSFKSRDMMQYRRWLITSTVLGVLFIITQWVGFSAFWKSGNTLQANVSFSFLYVIVGLHALHVAGGIIALIVMTLKTFSRTRRIYSTVPIELMATYWHFVDILSIYLLVFLVMIR